MSHFIKPVRVEKNLELLWCFSMEIEYDHSYSFLLKSIVKKQRMMESMSCYKRSPSQSHYDNKWDQCKLDHQIHFDTYINHHCIYLQRWNYNLHWEQTCQSSLWRWRPWKAPSNLTIRYHMNLCLCLKTLKHTWREINIQKHEHISERTQHPNLKWHMTHPRRSWTTHQSTRKTGSATRCRAATRLLEDAVARTCRVLPRSCKGDDGSNSISFLYVSIVGLEK